MLSDRQVQLHNNSMNIESVGGAEIVRLRDPFTGDDIIPGQPPRSIEAQPHLSAGLDYLRSHPEIRLTILADSHGNDDVIDKDEVKEVIANADSVYLEGFGANQRDTDQFWDVAAGNIRAVDIRSSNYKRQQYELLEGLNKPSLLPEIPAEGTEYESELLEFIAVLDELRLLAIDNENIQLAIEINLAASSIMREWYLLAKMGNYLSSLEQAGVTSTRPLLWIGSSHAVTMAPKLEGLGVGYQVVEPMNTRHDTAPNLLHGGDGLISYEEAASKGISRITRSN